MDGQEKFLSRPKCREYEVGYEPLEGQMKMERCRPWRGGCGVGMIVVG